MSLILSFPTPEGVIIGSDTQFGIGQSRERVSKIFRLSSKICWSATGEYALIQRVFQGLFPFLDTSQSLRELYPALSGVVKSSVKDLLSSDFRTEFFINNMGALAQLHRVDVVFVEFATTPIILHLNVFGSPVWVQERPFFIGPGDALAGAQYQRYKDLALNLSGATVVAYRLLDDAIETGIFGLGGPIDLWQATANGVEQLTETQLQSVQETVKTIRGHERAVFEKHLSLSVSH